ncbi:hypothetical protein ACFWUQ_15080 [Streptomyces sp. NPDC058662]|uniref:hypothetical protein n=1 Tax=Streptomyces sp. NPDC058662 TaxID=3346583 RepID=UPI003662A147
MRNHGSDDERAGEAGITTEDIANPTPATGAGTDTGTDTGTGASEFGDGTTGGRTPPVYPGEATWETATDEDGNEIGGRGDESPGDRMADTGPTGADRSTDEPLLGAQDTADYRKSWSEIQGRFVDDPQDAVRSADALVAEVMQTLARTFSDHKQGLEGQWSQGEQVATEDLRLALQRYRSFFNRLLNT